MLGQCTYNMSATTFANAYTITNSVDIYDVNLKSWAAGPSLPRNVGANSIATVQHGKLYLFAQAGSYVCTGEAWLPLGNAAGRSPTQNGAADVVCGSILLG